RKSSRLEAENRLLRAEGLPTFIAESATMAPVKELIARVGPSDANVLITGEHGTGKEVVARTLHAVSPRAARALVAVNAGGLAEVSAGHFREDLLFRLNTIEIRLPPLRERKEDIPILAVHFLAQYRERYRRPVSGFDDAALVALTEHSWPGNVRELDHTVERA